MNYKEKLEFIRISQKYKVVKPGRSPAPEDILVGIYFIQLVVCNDVVELVVMCTELDNVNSVK